MIYTFTRVVVSRTRNSGMCLSSRRIPFCCCCCYFCHRSDASTFDDYVVDVLRFLASKGFRVPKSLPDRIFHRKIAPENLFIHHFCTHFFRTTTGRGSELLLLGLPASTGMRSDGPVCDGTRSTVDTNTAPRYCLSIARSGGVRNDRKLAKFAFGKIKDLLVYKHI